MSNSYRTGLVVLGALSAVDVIGPLLTDGDHPPMWVAWIGTGIGSLSLIAVRAAWRGERRAVLPLVALQLGSALTAAPAFFVAGVPAPIRVLAAVLVLVTLGAVAMVAGTGRQKVAA